MKRLNLMVPEEDYEWLYEHAEDLDVSVAEVVRSAVSFWKKMGGDPYAVFFERDAFDPPDFRLPWHLPGQVLERLTQLERLFKATLTDEQLARLSEMEWSEDDEGEEKRSGKGDS